MTPKQRGPANLQNSFENFGTKFTDDGFIKRIKENGIHKKYDIGPNGIEAAIKEITGFEEYELPDLNPNF